MVRYTICEPLNPDVVDKGTVTKEEKVVQIGGIY